MGDPFSRYVQLLLTITRARDLVVVDDGTATMEFVAQLASGERLVRWHRRGGRPGARDLVFAPVSARARRRLTPGDGRTVEVFSAMPIRDARGRHHHGQRLRLDPRPGSARPAHEGRRPGRHVPGGDGSGGPRPLPGGGAGPRQDPRRHPLLRPPPGEPGEAAPAGGRDRPGDRPPGPPPGTDRPPRPHRPYDPELPLDRGAHAAARAGRARRSRVAVCDIDPAWLTENASPRAQGFLSGVTGTARDVHRLSRSRRPPDPAPRCNRPEAGCGPAVVGRAVPRASRPAGEQNRPRPRMRGMRRGPHPGDPGMGVAAPRFSHQETWIRTHSATRDPHG
jgi:hypothetical protein